MDMRDLLISKQNSNRSKSANQAADPPESRYRQLQPWLKLANLARSHLSIVPAVDANRFVAQFREAFAKELAELERQAEHLNINASLLDSPVPDFYMLLGLHQAICAL